MPKWHTCTSCQGLGYTHHQKLLEENGKTVSELELEQNCLICHGRGEVYS